MKVNVKDITPTVKEYLMIYFDIVKEKKPEMTEEEYLVMAFSQMPTYKDMYEIISIEVEKSKEVAKLNTDNLRDELMPFILGDNSEQE